VLVNLAEQAQTMYYLGAGVILAGAALEANYLFRVASRFYHPRAGQVLPAAHRGADVATASLLGAGLLASVLVLAPLAAQLESLALQAADAGHYVETVNPEVLP
jgi:hypothetical protein